MAFIIDTTMYFIRCNRCCSFAPIACITWKISRSYCDIRDWFHFYIFKIMISQILLTLMENQWAPDISRPLAFQRLENDKAFSFCPSVSDGYMRPESRWKFRSSAFFYCITLIWCFSYRLMRINIILGHELIWIYSKLQTIYYNICQLSYLKSRFLSIYLCCN